MENLVKADAATPKQLDDIQEAIRVAPDMLGARGPRVYFVALTTPADPNAAHRSLVFPAVESAARFHAVRIVNPGEGIPREYLPRLTERFYRAPGQKSGDTSGTGLGLAIVKHIVGRHHGGLFVESAEGNGAAFTVYFPAP